MLRASKTVRVFHYVDDFLVLFECVTGDVDKHVQRITDIFETTLAGLTLQGNFLRTSCGFWTSSCISGQAMFVGGMRPAPGKTFFRSRLPIPKS